MGGKKDGKKAWSRWKDYCYSKWIRLKERGSNLKKIIKKTKCRCH